MKKFQLTAEFAFSNTSLPRGIHIPFDTIPELISILKYGHICCITGVRDNKVDQGSIDLMEIDENVLHDSGYSHFILHSEEPEKSISQFYEMLKPGFGNRTTIPL